MLHSPFAPRPSPFALRPSPFALPYLRPMNPILKNILVVIIATVVGAMANGFIVQLGGLVVPPPAGYDFTTEEGLAAGMTMMEPKHFVFPFLAHALGTLISALIIARFAASRHLQWAINISALFFMGGVYMVTILPSPLWFNIIDLVFAYFPMAFLGYRLGKKA